MAGLISNRKSMIIKEAWEGCSPIHLTVTAFDGYDAYHGTLPLTRPRKYDPGLQSDNPDFDSIMQGLAHIPHRDIYPTFFEGITRFETPDELGCDSSYYLKAPSISSYSGNNTIAKCVLSEVQNYEKLIKYPHPNLGVYLGCVVYNGLIVRLAFRKYYKTLYDRVIFDVKTPDDFTFQERKACMDSIGAATKHLHQLGIAHNDISPSNIIFDNENVPILIDLDSCAPIGDKIVKGGCVAGWRGPFFDNGKTFKESSIECDDLAIQYIRDWLIEDLEKLNKKAQEVLEASQPHPALLSANQV